MDTVTLAVVAKSVTVPGWMITDPRISPLTFRVFALLGLHDGAMAVERIALKLGCSPDECRASVDELRLCGVIEHNFPENEHNFAIFVPFLDGPLLSPSPIPPSSHTPLKASLGAYNSTHSVNTHCARARTTDQNDASRLLTDEVSVVRGRNPKAATTDLAPFVAVWNRCKHVNHAAVRNLSPDRERRLRDFIALIHPTPEAPRLARFERAVLAYAASRFHNGTKENPAYPIDTMLRPSNRAPWLDYANDLALTVGGGGGATPAPYDPATETWRAPR